MSPFAPFSHLLVAHGLAISVEDLPLPLGAFYVGAVVALAVSFAVLAVGYRTPRFAGDVRRAAPAWVVRLAHARASCVALGVLAVAWLALVVATALAGATDGAENPAPNLVFVLGWIGLPVAALLLGRGVLALLPVAAVARFGGMREHTSTPLAPGAGVWLAWGGLLVFVWLELVYPTSTHVRILGALVLAWLVGGLAACSRWGVRTWLERVDPFGTYARLLATMSPWQRRADGSLGIGAPLLGATRGVERAPGMVALVTLLIGSVSYDGLTRTGWWQQRVSLATADLTASGVEPATGRILFGTFGLALLVLVAWGAFELASLGAARIGRLDVGRGLARSAQQFAPSLLPIALAYVVAHYFSFFVVQVQDLARHASDPFGRGVDWLGTADLTVRDYWRPTGRLVWLVQVGAIVVGHVVGLLLAHDRALELAPRSAEGTIDVRAATLSQLPMLLLMLLYTVGGLYFLSEGLS